MEKEENPEESIEKREETMEEWQQKVVTGLALLKQGNENLKKEVVNGDAAICKKVDALTTQMNGRIKRLEHAVFGDEEKSKVGVVEKVRSMESGWAKVTAGAVLFALAVIEAIKFAGNIVFDKFTGG